MDMIKLVQKAKEGDKDAQRELYEVSYKKVYYLALRITKNPEDAEDVAQESFISAFKALPNLQNNNAFEGWLFQIVANKCRNKLTRTKQVDALPEGFEEHTPDTSEGILPEDILQDAEKRRMIMEIVNELSDVQRECVMLFYYSQLSVKEIAKSLDISEGTVKSRLNYARQKIKDGILETEDRDGIRLHTLVPFGLIFANDLEVATANLTASMLSGAGVAGGVATVVGATSETAKAGLMATLKAKIIASITAATMVVGGVVIIAQMPKAIDFSDPVLEQNIRVMIDKPEGKITEKDVEGVTELYFYDDGVAMNQLASEWVDEAQSGTTYMFCLSDLDVLPNVTSIYNNSSDPDLLSTLGVNENIVYIFAPSGYNEAMTLDDVSFLEDLPSLQSFSATLSDGMDISPIEQHQNLRELNIYSYGDIEINCDELVNLLSLNITIKYSDQNPDGKVDIKLTQTLPKLMMLRTSGQLKTLDFLDFMPQIQLFDIYCQNLSTVNLQPLAGLSQLRVIGIDATYDSKIDLAPLSSCSLLEVYSMHNGEAINVPPQAISDTEGDLPFYNEVSLRVQEEFHNIMHEYLYK